jgi:hypothetical protein
MYHGGHGGPALAKATAGEDTEDAEDTEERPTVVGGPNQ